VSSFGALNTCWQVGFTVTISLYPSNNGFMLQSMKVQEWQAFNLKILK